MLLNQTNFTSISSPNIETKAFGVNFDSVMAYSFMSGIAKDKISYPIREIGTNAYDANPNTPFDVTLPTIFDPTFSVRDYGPGLSHEHIMSVYTTFGGSLKRNTNDQVGGLGLGSKSPFAYLISRTPDGAASFTVRSFHNGSVQTYIMSLSPNGMPECRYFGSTPIPPSSSSSSSSSSTSTGLEVSFVVDRADINQFHEAVKEIYWHFPTQPKLSTGSFSQSQPISQSTEYKIYGSDAPFHGPHVRMGCVAYPINISLIDPKFPFANQPIVFDAPIGSLSFTTSREELGYDATTKDQLSKLLSQFLIDYPADIQIKIDEATSYIDACKIFSKLTASNPAIDILNQRSLISYKTKPLRSTFSGTKSRYNVMIIHNPSDIPSIIFTPTGHGSRSDKKWTISLDLLYFKSVVYSKNRSYQNTRLNQLQLQPDQFPILWIRPKDPAVTPDQIIEHWDLSHYNPINLDKVKIDRSSYANVPKPNIRSLAYLNSSSDLSKERHNLDDGGVYIIKQPRTRMYRLSSYTDGVSNEHKDGWVLKNMFQFFNNNNPDTNPDPDTNPNPKLWVFDPVTASTLDANPNWVPLATAVRTILEPKVDLAAIRLRQQENKLPYDYERYSELLKYLDTDSVSPDFVDFCNRVAKVLASRSSTIDADTKRYLEWFPLAADDTDLKNSFETELQQLCDKYPLLRMLINHTPRWNQSEKSTEPLNHYFQLLNNQSQKDR